MSIPMRTGLRVLCSLGLLTATACFPTGGTTSPGDASKAGGTVKIAKRPFIVNWSPTERTALETSARDGAVVLAWNANTKEAEVLSRCHVGDYQYRFVGTSHARQTMSANDSLELGANFPFAGPVNLGAKLETYGEINVEYHTIGEYKTDVGDVHVDDLEGSCAGATHVVAALSIGAFKLFAGEGLSGGAEADVPMAAGVNAGGSRSSENLDQGGVPESCDAASRNAEEPPDGCDSVLAVELITIVRDSPFIAGERWDGSYECNDRKATSGFVVDDVQDDGGVMVTVDFDYADVQGVFLAKGTLDASSGALKLEFVEWKEEPAGYVPVTPVGVVDPVKGEFSGELSEEGCSAFSYRRGN